MKSIVTFPGTYFGGPIRFALLLSVLLASVFGQATSSKPISSLSDLNQLTAILVAEPVGQATAPYTESPDQLARKSLEASANAYRRVWALRDKLIYVVKAPGSEQEPKTLEYGFGPRGTAYVRDSLYKAVAIRGRLFIIKSDVPDKYVVTPYKGDFAASLNRVVGKEGSLFAPPPISLHEGEALQACLETLRFKLLDPLRITGFERVVSASGRSLDEIRFTANNGQLSLRIDSITHFFAEVSFEVRPPGSPEGFYVRVNGNFAPRVVTGRDALIDFAPGGRVVVLSLADFGSSRLIPGSSAPDFDLMTLDGRRVSLHDLRGSVVVLDFWATWCIPCWKTLRETQALFDWAAATHLSVAVLPVNTLEEETAETAKRERVATFWRSQHFLMPTLFDSDSAVFRAYDNPGLPSMVLVAPDGTILKHHQGLFSNMQPTLQREIRAALPAKR